MRSGHEETTVDLHLRDRGLTATVRSPPPVKLAPAPLLLLNFATDRATSLGRDPYRATPEAFLEAGHRAASFDLPAHGERVDAHGEGIAGLRDALLAGQDPFARFVADGAALVDVLIAEGLATAGRIAVAGTSRGGYAALRLLAADERIAAGAGFAPVTDWRLLTEFEAHTERPEVADLGLTRFVDGLAARRVFLAIGRHDERVGTAACRQLHGELTRAGEAADRRGDHVLLVTGDPGHTMGTEGYEEGRRFLLQGAGA